MTLNKQIKEIPKQDTLPHSCTILVQEQEQKFTYLDLGQYRYYLIIQNIP
jgi:hypothetical protein